MPNIDEFKKIRALAFYLPQFYPTPYNNEWWGEGFTEWTNVTKTFPRFKEHYQPHLPADLGFYDLRLIENMELQASLAKKSLIEGFVYYHYWFSGSVILEKPVDNLLTLKTPDFPFCLCWANQNWSRNWDGGFNKVLIEQNYSLDDDLNHIHHLFKYFQDDRYIKIDGKPVFIVYRTELFPDIKKTADLWREEAMKYGFKGLYLINIENIKPNVDPKELNFDAGLSFHPRGEHLPKHLGKNKLNQLTNKISKIKSSYYTNNIWDYQDYANLNIQKKFNYKLYPGLFPMWDNSSRREKDAWIFHNSTPTKYGNWLQESINSFIPYSKEENFIFINAWNEWAEGNHLEPCQKWGKAYLNETKRILEKYT